MVKYLILLVVSLGLQVLAADIPQQEEDGGESRLSKILPIFQVVRFPNDVCTGTSRNGTCYTAEECSSKGGVSEGSCASGFGVCCVVKLSCGGTSSENNTYIVQSSVTSLDSPCTYSICPCSRDICRIRYDFNTHVLEDQVTMTAAANPDDTAGTSNGATGDCTTDQFSINTPGLFSSPTICGTNTDYHMILDSNGVECQTANFWIGSSTTTTRQWDIYVTQYTCGQEDLGGPPGCLQYHTGTTGLVKSFGYKTSNSATATAADTTHLSNQNYRVCVRREKSYCYICWSQWDTAGSFGLSISDIAGTARSGIGTDCELDYIEIPQGTTAAIAAISDVSAAGITRYCGRFLAMSTTGTADVTVCSKAYPFTLGVTTNEDEVCSDAEENMAILCEASVTPGGIIGFALGFSQMSC